MFLRFVRQSIFRAPRRKAMTIAAVAMGSAVATAMLGVMLDVGDRVNRELRALGANLIVTPKGQSLPVEIGGVNYRPVARAEFIPQADLPRIKSTFWHLNIIGYVPVLHAGTTIAGRNVPVDGVWFSRGANSLRVLNSAWKVHGRWIEEEPDRHDEVQQCMLGSALGRRLDVAPGGKLTMFGEPFTVAGLLETGGAEEDRAFVPLEVLQRLTGRAGQVDAVEVSALTKPEDAFARRDPARMTPAEYDRWYCTPYVSSIAHQI